MEVASHDLSGEPPFYPNTLVFRTLTGGRFDIYFDAQPNADVADGIGFDDGALVATGALENEQDRLADGYFLHGCTRELYRAGNDRLCQSCVP